MEVGRLYRRGLFLEYLTVGYNVVEAVVAIVFGGVAGSIALIGFGLDSVVESLSGVVLIWRLRQHGRILPTTIQLSILTCNTRALAERAKVISCLSL